MRKASRIVSVLCAAVHTHPWDLSSSVVAGRYKQHRYTEVIETWKQNERGVESFQVATIQCGKDACVKGEPEQTYLREGALEIYVAGDSYIEAADEIHLSLPEDGTVTLVTRTFKEDTEHARIFWRGSGGWVDAKPRDATPEEIKEVTERALQTWF